MPLTLFTLLLMLCLAGCGGEGDAGGETQFLNIGTGGETGVYYPTGGAISKLVSEHSENLRMTASTSTGSVDNINSVIGGQIDFGIVQSDAQFNAVNGLEPWEGDAKENLRHVMSLYPEAVTLVAAVDAEINSITDLRGKRVNIGPPGSGTRANALMALEIAGLSEDDFRTETLSEKEAPRILQDNRLDAFFYTVGHPAGAFEEAMAGSRKLQFVSLTGIDQITEQYPFMQPTTIRKEMYARAEGGDAETVGLTTTIITTAELDEEAVYQVVKATVENIETLKATHPALRDLTAESLARPGTAEFHPGARRYFEEAGLLAAP